MMDQEAALALTFSELQCLDQEDVSILVDIQAALKISKESLEEIPIVEVLNLWLKKLLRAYVKENICCQEAFLEMKEWVQDMIGADTDLVVVFSEALDFLSSIQDDLTNASEVQMHAASNFLLALVLGVLDEERTMHHHGDNLPLAIKLHLNVLTLLQGINSNSSQSKETPSIHLLPVVQQMNRISEFLSSKIKYLEAFILTSQMMTQLCLHYTNHSKSCQTMPEWLKETILHLCDTIINHYETIHMKETLTVPIQKIEDYLKVTQKYFYMLIEIYKTDIKHTEETVMETLIELLMGGESKSLHDLGHDLNRLLAEYVRPCALELYGIIYKLDGFQKHLIDSLNDPEEADNDYFDLCLDYIHVAIIDDSKITSLTCRTLQNIFEYMFKDSRYFIEANSYDCIIEAFGSLLYLVDCEPLRDYFCLNLIKNDLIISQVCGDILNIWLRLQKWPSNSLEEAINYWELSNNSYAKCSENVSRWQVEHLLKYLKGLKRMEFSIPEEQILERMLCIKDKALNKIGLYYELIDHMDVLAQKEVECPKWFQQSLEVSRRWLSMEKCSSFANAYFRLALVQQRQDTKLVILRGLNPMSAGCKSWYGQKFVFKCQQMKDAQIKAFSSPYAVLPQLSPLLKLEIGEFELNSSSDRIEKLFTEFVLKPRPHNCNLKRKSSKDALEVKQLIDQLYVNSMQLRECASQLDSSDKEQVKRIITNLKSTGSTF